MSFVAVETMLGSRWRLLPCPRMVALQQQHGVTLLRKLSSVAADETIMRTDYEGAMGATIDSSSSSVARPRLMDLRRKLEKVDDPVQCKLKKALRVSQNGRRKDVSHSTTTKSYTRDDWLALVEMLPDPPSKDQVLSDRFHRQHSYLRLSLAERCNLRCTYCMPENGVDLQPSSLLLQTDELLHLASFFKAYGVNKFRLTGGEPTLRSDLEQIVGGLKAMKPHQIGMTTNGVALANKIPQLVDKGLDSVNLSLDTMKGDRFEALTRRPAAYLDKVLESLEVCYKYMPASQLKINVVLMRGVNTDEVASFIELGITKFPGISVRFIEYMPFTGNGWELDKLVPYTEVLESVSQEPREWQIQKIPQADPHDTTKWYRAQATDGSFVNLGFITSMSQPFCAGCNRLRLSADGQLKVCLFGSVYHEETTKLPSIWSLRDAIRVGKLDDDQLSKLVHAALQTKHFALGGHDSPQTIHDHAKENKPMTLIGG